VYNPDLGATLSLIKKANAMCVAAYGDDLNGDSAREFMAVIVMADAINRAGSTDPEAIRKALRESNYTADEIMLPWPGIKFDPETGQNQLGEGIIVQVQDGVFRTVWPFDVATTDIVWPMPQWSER
jgi:branched-chain amino acid transport system substrate-binding protein